MAGRNTDVRVNFIGDADSLARAAAKARHDLDSVGRRGHAASTALGTAVGFGAARAVTGLASLAAGGVRSLGEMANASVDAASATAESVSKSRQVFGRYSQDVEAWANDNSKNILLSRQAATEGAATFGNLFVALGVGDKAAAGMSTTLVGLASDLSSFDNTSTDDALLALRSGLLGEAEPMRKFGVSLSEARVEAEAYALGLAKPVKNAAAITSANNKVAAATANVTAVERSHGKGTLAAAQARDTLARAEAGLAKATSGSKAALSDAIKVHARQSIILKDTAKAQGDAARTLDGEANSTRVLDKRMADLSATLGVKLLPYKIRAVQATAELVDEFEKGTGTGGQIRDALVGVGDAAREVGGVLNDTVVPAVKFFVDHPDTFRLAAEGMAAYAIASKAAVVSNALLAVSVPKVAVGMAGTAAAAPGAAAGVTAVGTAASRSMPLVAALTVALVGLYEGYKSVRDLDKNQALFDKDFAGIKDLYDIGAINSDQAGKLLGDATRNPGSITLPTRPRHDPRTPDDYDAKAGRGKTALAVSITNEAAKAAAATTAGAVKLAAAQKYATDQFAANEKRRNDAIQAAAEAKRKAAEALEAATQKVRDALTKRTDASASVRDSLVSSNTVLQAGISWTAKDLLAAFQKKMAKVKEFAAALSALTHKGYAPSIIGQIAAAGVDGGMATAKGLASASAAQVAQFNGVQGGIDRAAGYAGDRAAKGVYGLAPKPTTQIIKLVVDGKTLAQAVNKWNAQASGRGAAT